MRRGEGGGVVSKDQEIVETTARNIERPYRACEVVRQRMQTLKALALSAGEAAIDVGCGIGLLTYELALEVGSTGRVVGIDNSSEMLQRAGERCVGLNHVQFKEGSATQVPEADNGFDAAACVQVLLYVPDVPAALAEPHRVLKPGGRVAILETDWRSVVLNSSDQDLTRRIFAAWDDAVASPNLPLRLGPLLRQQSFSGLRVEAIAILDTSDSDGTFSGSGLDWLIGVAQEQGVISGDEGSAWLCDLRRKGREGAYFFCVNRFLFSAVKL